MANPAPGDDEARRLSSEELYSQLGYLVAAMPDFFTQPMPMETEFWLAKAYALVTVVSDDLDRRQLRRYTQTVRHFDSGLRVAVREIHGIVYRALALAELRAPAVAQGSFIPAGNAFAAMGAVGKVLQPATASALIVDPYMDEKALTDFAVLAAPGVTIRLLADQTGKKPSLKPAAARWITQHGSTRPLETRLAPSGALHDRLIIVDDREAWVLTQSLNAFAVRSPATIVRVDPETASLKVTAYSAMWQAANPL